MNGVGVIVLTEQQWFLLEWLGREETSALGECKGAALERLLAERLAEIDPQPVGKHPDYARVRLTEFGWRALRGRP